MRREPNPNRVTRPALPYLDNLRAVLITLAINLVLVLATNPGLKGYGPTELAIDAVVCGLLTAAIDVVYVQSRLAKAWNAGLVPEEVPVSQWIGRLPRGGLGLVLVLGTAAAAFCAAFNLALFRYYGFTHWTFGQFLLYKLVYALILSEQLVSLAILRMVHPDCDPRREASPTATEGGEP